MLVSFIYLDKVRQRWAEKEPAMEGQWFLHCLDTDHLQKSFLCPHFFFRFGYSESFNSHTEIKDLAFRQVTQVTFNFLCHGHMAQWKHWCGAQSRVLLASTVKHYFSKVAIGNSEGRKMCLCFQEIMTAVLEFIWEIFCLLLTDIS